MNQPYKSNIDHYYHCMANCQATNLGDGGWNAARFISETKEVFDEYAKGSDKESCNADRKANYKGQQGGNCVITCTPTNFNIPKDWKP